MLVYAASFAAAAMLLSLDQWAKFWVESNMQLDETLPLLGPLLELHAVHNYGAAWSIFSGARWLLVAITTVMIAAVIGVLCLKLVRHPLGVAAAFLILAGGIGNLMDRIFLGYVVDMLRFAFWRSYPTFNVADVCVVTGCVLWLIYILLVRENPNETDVTEDAGPTVRRMGRTPGGGMGPVPAAETGHTAGPGGLGSMPGPEPVVPPAPVAADTWSGGDSYDSYEEPAEEEPEVLRDPRSDSSLYRRY